MQRRFSGVQKLALIINCCRDRQEDQPTVKLERELITAHLLLVLSNAQTYKLRKLKFVPVQQRHQCPELSNQLYRAISRFTLLTYF